MPLDKIQENKPSFTSIWPFNRGFNRPIVAVASRGLPSDAVTSEYEKFPASAVRAYNEAYNKMFHKENMINSLARRLFMYAANLKLVWIYPKGAV